MNYEPTFTNRYNHRRILLIDKKQAIPAELAPKLANIALSIIIGTLFFTSLFFIAI